MFVQLDTHDRKNIYTHRSFCLSPPHQTREVHVQGLAPVSLLASAPPPCCHPIPPGQGEGMPGAHSPATWQRAPQASGRTSWDTGPADSPQRPPAGGHQTATCVPEMPPTRPTSDLEPSLKVCVHLTKSKKGEPLPAREARREATPVCPSVVPTASLPPTPQLRMT